MSREQLSASEPLAVNQALGAPPTGEPWRGGGEGSILTVAQKQQILQDRARALAREAVQDKMQEEMMRVVEFSLARERYAVEAVFVRGVHRIQQITPIPCTPSFVLGVINVHGRILSVIDLRAFFDLSPASTARRETIVMLRTKELEIGVLVDEVFGSLLLPVKSVKATAPGRSGIRRGYLRGVVDEQLIVLDVERILSDKRMIVGGDEIEL